MKYNVGNAEVACCQQGGTESTAPAPKVSPQQLPRSSPSLLQEPSPLLAGFKMAHLSIVGEYISVVVETA